MAVSRDKGRAAVDPAVDAMFQRALVLHRQAQIAHAESLYKEILGRELRHFGALHYLGVIEGQRGNCEAAVALIDRALRIDPNSAPAHSNRGIFLRKLGRHEEALASFERAIAIKSDHAEALYNRGNVLRQLERHEEALASYASALAIKPDYAEAHYSRGNVLTDLRQPREALASYDRALAIRPAFADALVNRGYVLLELGRNEEALASYDRALAIRPDFAEAFYNRGIALTVLKRHGEAIADFETVLRLDPDYPYARGKLIHAKLECCDWSDYESDVAAVMRDIRAGKRACQPFTGLAIADSPSDQLLCARLYAQDVRPESAVPFWQGECYRHDRIRVAYLSADFREHPVAYLTAGLFERHDRARFEPIAISFGPDGPSAMRARLERVFERFIDVREKSDIEVARLLRALEVDIAVDLMGFTTDSRPQILASRPAPVQVNYLGYPGSMGTGFIDYIVADRTVIPETSRHHYGEKIVYLPDTYQANDSTRRIADHAPSRREAGLPDGGFVFCSFNNTYKIAPAVFDIWMRLLHDVEGSVLWLLESHAAAAANLRREAAAKSIAPERLVFAPRIAVEDYLARYRLADLFLDTLPYNAGTTASDALWAGLPVVTCLGESFAGRMAGSLLNAVGLPELVAGSLEDYAALAERLAKNGDVIAAIRAKLARNRLTHPLFDTARFCRHIEAAYMAMHECRARGEPPDHILVEAID